MKGIMVIAIVLACMTTTAQTNYALSLNGTSQYVTIGTPLSTNGSYTKEAWVYATSNSGSRNIISSLNTPFWVSNGTLLAGQAGNFSIVSDATTFPLNTWVHVAVTYDAATSTMKLYRDGMLVSTATSVSSYTSESTYIGSHQGSLSFWQGSIDEVRIWNTALTQAQLKQYMYKGPANNATGLVAYYKCNDGSGSTLTSSCTNTSGLNGTLQNSPPWVSSPVQYGANALSFDGTDDVVNIADNNTLHITSAITLEAWVYATKNSGMQNVICKSSNTANTGYIFPRTDDGWSHVVLYLHIGSWKTISAAYPSLNAWHHLAATYDGSTMKLYIDGVLAASQAQTGSISSNSNVLALGNQTGFSENFGGYADELRVWNVARTQTEIQSGMSKELTPSTQTGLVSYYTINQGGASGTNTGLTNIIDQTGSNNGSMSNFSLSGASSNFITQNSGISLLPLQWLGFTVQPQNDNILLRWSTTNEENTQRFTIQHSVNGAVWEDVGSVAAANVQNTVNNYNYTHTPVAAGLHYYRIRQTDIDGRGQYSDTRSIKLSMNGPSWSIQNNPVTNGRLQLQLNKAAQLALYNNAGQLLRQQPGYAGTTMIDVSGYAKGVYWLAIDHQTEKIIIQ